MKIYKSSNPANLIQKIISIEHANPETGLVVCLRNGKKASLYNREIRSFIEEWSILKEIDQSIVDDIKKDFSHLFISHPTQDDLEKVYEGMLTLIINELKNANIENKQLLFLAGENHASNGSLMLQTMLLYIFKEKKINQLLVELPASQVSKLIHRTDDLKRANAEHTIPLAHALQFNLIDADPENNDLKSMSERESFMINKILNIKNHSSFITGGAHLKGLMSDINLNKKYRIIGLNIGCYSDAQMDYDIRTAISIEIQKGLEFLSTKKAIRINLSGNLDLFTGAEILEIAKRIHLKKLGFSGYENAFSQMGLEAYLNKKSSPTFFSKNQHTNNVVPPELNEALINGGVDDYIKKGHAKLEQLIELHKIKPKTIQAMRYGNIRKGIFDGYITMDQLSQLTEDEATSIAGKNIEGIHLQQKVESFNSLSLQITKW